MATMKVTRSRIYTWELEQHKKRRKCSSTSREGSAEKGKIGSSDEFNKLSADVITCIFLRCPEKTLSMLRCISKSWNDFIVSPSFFHSHLKQSSANGPQLLFKLHKYFPRSRMSRLQFVSVDMQGNIEELYTVTVPDSQLSCCTWRVCSGLLCLSTDCRVYLCNPALHQLRELPNCSPSAAFGYILFGLAYLPSRKEYKVLHFFYRGPGPRSYGHQLQLAQLRCEVFTLHAGPISSFSCNGWKEIAEAPPCHLSSPGLLVNELMYWLGRLPPHVQADRIVSFDFENEKFLTISFPPFDISPCISMMDLKGMLCLPDTLHFLTSSILDLWILKDNISCTWMKEYSINFGNFGPEKCTTPYFRMTWNEEIVYTNSDMVIFYDINTKCFRRVKRLGVFDFEIYSKGLLSLENI